MPDRLLVHDTDTGDCDLRALTPYPVVSSSNTDANGNLPVGCEFRSVGGEGVSVGAKTVSARTFATGATVIDAATLNLAFNNFTDATPFATVSVPNDTCRDMEILVMHGINHGQINVEGISIVTLGIFGEASIDSGANFQQSSSPATNHSLSGYITNTTDVLFQNEWNGTFAIQRFVLPAGETAIARTKLQYLVQFSLADGDTQVRLPRAETIVFASQK